ncbi:hypothetical protein D516_0928 [Rhodobacter sp. AKP1]|nr:hypothetical protein D516_0928 [Rhodobacter sp. AKP1]
MGGGCVCHGEPPVGGAAAGRVPGPEDARAGRRCRILSPEAAAGVKAAAVRPPLTSGRALLSPWRKKC